MDRGGTCTEESGDGESVDEDVWTFGLDMRVRSNKGALLTCAHRFSGKAGGH